MVSIRAEGIAGERKVPRLSLRFPPTSEHLAGPPVFDPRGAEGGGQGVAAEVRMSPRAGKPTYIRKHDNRRIPKHAKKGLEVTIAVTDRE